MPQLAHIALIVRDYDDAIAWFTATLGFTLVEDNGGAALSGGQREGGPAIQPEQDKRWVVIAPPGAPPGATTILLAPH